MIKCCAFGFVHHSTTLIWWLRVVWNTFEMFSTEIGLFVSWNVVAQVHPLIPIAIDSFSSTIKRRYLIIASGLLRRDPCLIEEAMISFAYRFRLLSGHYERFSH